MILWATCFSLFVLRNYIPIDGGIIMRYRQIKQIRDGELMAAQVYEWERKRDPFIVMDDFRSDENRVRTCCPGRRAEVLLCDTD